MSAPWKSDRVRHVKFHRSSVRHRRRRWGAVGRSCTKRTVTIDAGRSGDDDAGRGGERRDDADAGAGAGARGEPGGRRGRRHAGGCGRAGGRGARAQRDGDGGRAPGGGRAHPRAHPLRDHAHAAAPRARPTHGTRASRALAFTRLHTAYTPSLERSVFRSERRSFSVPLYTCSLNTIVTEDFFAFHFHITSFNTLNLQLLLV